MATERLTGTAFLLSFFGAGQQRIDTLNDYRLSCLDMAASAERNGQPLFAAEARAEAAKAEQLIGRPSGATAKAA